MEQRAHRSELCDPPGHPRRFTAPCGKCPPVQPHRPRPGPAAAAQRGDAPLLAGGWGWRYGFCSDGADCSARLAAGFVNFIQFGPIAGGERLVQPGPLSPTPRSLARSLPPPPPPPSSPCLADQSLPGSVSLHRQPQLLLADRTLPLGLIAMNFLPECRSLTRENTSFLQTQWWWLSCCYF